MNGKILPTPVFCFVLTDKEPKPDRVAGLGRAGIESEPAGFMLCCLLSLPKEPRLRQKRKRRKRRGNCLDGRPSHVYPCPLAGPVVRSLWWTWEKRDPQISSGSFPKLTAGVLG